MSMVLAKKNDDGDFIYEKGCESKLPDGYSFGDFKDFTGYIEDTNCIVYSYDTRSHNFHIVPNLNNIIEQGVVEQYIGAGEYLLSCIDRSLSKYGIDLKGGTTSGSPSYSRAHLYKFCRINENEYSISLNRLWCDNQDKVNNSMGKIQFMRYYKDKDGPNFIRSNGNFEMMYPNTDEDGDGKYSETSLNMVFNPFGLSIKSNPEEIAESYIRFVEREQIRLMVEREN